MLLIEAVSEVGHSDLRQNPRFILFDRTAKRGNAEVGGFMQALGMGPGTALQGPHGLT
jgi:hypothetical protein